MEIKDYIFFIAKLFLFSGGLLLLLVALLRKTKQKMEKLSAGKYIKIIEKTQLSKTESIYVLKLGDEGSVIMSSGNGIEKIKDLTKEDMSTIENHKDKVNDDMVLMYNNGVFEFKNKAVKFMGKFKRNKNEE
ncbi:flagellar biosynthetic protein FliO [uncultured Clostridium sp.]|uniref:flagellar biosynthetic protein FliO n=1 Tax=uncultured Clostridium sp. TaxID=59620 RepID=UPI0026211052|nr:flagellar biosynthetic protein FliO [uncultured Clostridium sp.]